MNINPVISVIIPLYNKERSIKRTVLSFHNQAQSSSCELIVVDDGSTDDSSLKIEELSAEGINIKYVYQANSGVSSARNYGSSIAKGKFLYFLDADDLMREGCLELLLKMVNDWPDERIYCCNFEIRNSNQLVNESYCSAALPTVILEPIKEIWFGNLMSRAGAFLINKKHFIDVGGFSRELSYYEDMEFILKAFDVNQIIYLEHVVFSYDIEFASLSVAKPNRCKDWFLNLEFDDNYHSSLIKGKMVVDEIIKRSRRGDFNFIFSVISSYKLKVLFFIYSKFRWYYDKKIN